MSVTDTGPSRHQNERMRETIASLEGLMRDKGCVDDVDGFVSVSVVMR